MGYVLQHNPAKRVMSEIRGDLEFNVAQIFFPPVEYPLSRLSAPDVRDQGS